MFWKKLEEKISELVDMILELHSELKTRLGSTGTMDARLNMMPKAWTALTIRKGFQGIGACKVM